MPTILIASYLEPEYVDRIRAVDARLTVHYHPELLYTPRYPADHWPGEFTRTAEGETRWRAMLAESEILFDFDKSNAADLATLAPKLRWIQATSAGIGEFMAKHSYATQMPNVTFTTCSGVHAQPLAEWCVLVLLAFHKKFLETLADQRRKHWERFATADLKDQTLVIVGMGNIGTEVARMGKAFGMRTIGVKRTIAGIVPADLHLDALYGPHDLHVALKEAQNLVLITPRTKETEQMIGARELAMLPKGALFINIGRGALVDEPALIASLRSGHLRGAGLDVFATEPLPPSSPFWEMDNVIVCPHSASTADRENERITDIFCDNLRRYLDVKPLLNVYDRALGF
ncbi:3-phosphoglycerate dehydrogenase [Gemmatimonadota bacterium]|nr:3-phosphoglycerate dehydrogenase [Gemmatimonadota bacterium]